MIEIIILLASISVVAWVIGAQMGYREGFNKGYDSAQDFQISSINRLSLEDQYLVFKKIREGMNIQLQEAKQKQRRG